MSLLNWGAGLSAAGSAVASFAGNAGIAQQKADLEKQQAILADQLVTTRENNLAHVQGNEARQTATTTAGAQGDQSRQTAKFDNELPLTAAQKATVDNAAGTLAETTRHNKADESKPISGGYTASFLVRNPTTEKWELQNAATSAAPIEVDKNSDNLSAQTGLSSQAINMMTGQTKGQRVSAQQNAALQKEITEWGIKNNLNTSTMVPQAEAAFHVLQNNIQRNNQGTILEKEIDGTIENAAQIADDIKQGRINMANVVNVWAGKQVNDPKTIQAADQLGRLRNEIASYNAVAGGHLMQNGTPEPTPADFKEAESTITNGINSGGLKALQQSIAMSAAKNRNVLEESIHEANRSYYKLFGATYRPPASTVEQSGGGGANAAGAPTTGGSGGAPAASASPKTPIPGTLLGKTPDGRDVIAGPDGTPHVRDQ